MITDQSLSRTKDDIMASCLRILWLEVSIHGFELRAVRLPGEENRIADWHSQCHKGVTDQNSFLNFTEGDTDGLYGE